MSEHDREPIRGLPAYLPAGESLLWQGRPCYLGLAVRAFHARKIAVYFLLLLVWHAASSITAGTSWGDALASGIRLIGVAAAAVGLLTFFAWLVARTTVYTITSHRLVVRSGIAVPTTINLPFSAVESAGLRRYADGSGDIPLSLLRSQRVAYLMLWPHVKPWSFGRVRPMLRSIPAAAGVAEILARALAASADQPSRAVSDSTPQKTSPKSLRPRAPAAA